MPTDINSEINKIKYAVHGSDMRDSIVSALNKLNSGSGVTDQIKEALLAVFRNVAYIDESGQHYYNALYAALNESGGGSEDPDISIDSIYAVINQGYEPVCTTDSIETIRRYITVTARYSNNVEIEVNNYTLSGELTAGVATITVQYMGKTDTVQVEVIQLPTGYTHRTCIVTDGTQGTWSGLYETDMQGLSIVYKALKTDDGVEKTGHVLSSLNYFTPYLRDISNNRTISFQRFGNQEATVVTAEYLDMGVPYTFEAYLDGNRIRTLEGKREVLLPSGQTMDSSRQLSFFAYSSNGTSFNSTFSFHGKFYFMKLFNGSTVVHNYIPCTNSNNVAGLYDTVAGRFLTPVTGSFAWE